jgi:hypothetical protein
MRRAFRSRKNAQAIVSSGANSATTIHWRWHLDCAFACPSLGMLRWRVVHAQIVNVVKAVLKRVRDSLWCKCKSQLPLFAEKAMREDSRC